MFNDEPREHISKFFEVIFLPAFVIALRVHIQPTCTQTYNVTSLLHAILPFFLE